MAASLPKGVGATRSKVWLTLLCVLLLVFIGTVQVVHLHSDGTDTHANCSLCVVAHAAVQTLVPFAVPAPATKMEPSERPLQSSRSGQAPVFALFTRPPPVLSFR